MTVAVKICGLSTPEAVQAAVAGGAAYIGAVFFPPSPRAVTPERAAALFGPVPARVCKVGLFVDPEDRLIERVLSRVDLDMLQLHGSEPPERCAAVRERFGRPVMKAASLAAAEDLERAARWFGAVDLNLFDAKPSGAADALPGGNGRPFDWSLIAGRRFPVPWMLSGGLNAANLGAALATAGAPAVDVSSGVETSPGVKDPRLIREFLAAAAAL